MLRRYERNLLEAEAQLQGLRRARTQASAALHRGEKRNLTLVRDPEDGRRQEGRLLAQAKGDFTGDHERVMGIAESSLHGKWYNTLHFL